MKTKRILKGLAILLIAVICQNCDKAVVPLKSSFPFEVRADYDTNTFVNIPVDAIFDLKPQHIVTTNVYSFSYLVLEGKASLSSSTDKKTLFEREVYVVEDFRLKTSIIPKSTGKVSVEFAFFDQEGETTVKKIDINSSDTNFVVSSTGSLSNLVMGERVQISYEIAEQGTTSIDDYTLVFSSSENGYMTVNSRDYLAGEKIQVPSLNFIAFYTPTAAGEHIITSKITANSNSLVQTSDVSVSVEGSQFEFNVAAPIEVTIGKSIDLNFVIDEVLGNSDFDISYAVTGVNGEFRDANNVVLQPNQNYDVDNTFKWTLKGIEQGDMEVTFTVKNQFGVEETKTIPIEVKPIDFDFSVEPVGTVFELGKPIPIQFLMDAPSSLSYTLSFSANTDGIIEIGLGKLQEGGSIAVTNTDFTANYTPSLSGNSVLSLTITASNGVVKTQQINFQVQQKPVVTKIEITASPIIAGGSDCHRFTNRRQITLNWQKAPNTTIVAANVTVNGELITTNFAPFISASNNEVQLIDTSCIRNAERNFEIIATVTDSKGLVSEPLKNTINF